MATKNLTVANVTKVYSKLLEMIPVERQEEAKACMQPSLPKTYSGPLRIKVHVEVPKKPADLIRPKTADEQWIIENCTGKKNEGKALTREEKVAELNAWKTANPGEYQNEVKKHEEKMREYVRRQKAENPKKDLAEYEFNEETGEYNKVKGKKKVAAAAAAADVPMEVEERADERVEPSVKVNESAIAQKVKKPVVVGTKKKTVSVEED
jgi:hypothetical protein